MCIEVAQTSRKIMRKIINENDFLISVVETAKDKGLHHFYLLSLTFLLE